MEEVLDYEKLTDTNKELIKKAIDKALANGDEIYFNVYNECDRTDGTPWIESVNTPDDAYECETYEKDGKEHCDIYLVCPDFDKHGCADLVIETKDHTYYILYQDSTEERVYIDDINDYLAQSGQE